VITNNIHVSHLLYQIFISKYYTDVKSNETNICDLLDSVFSTGFNHPFQGYPFFPPGGAATATVPGTPTPPSSSSIAQVWPTSPATLSYFDPGTVSSLRVNLLYLNVRNASIIGDM